MRKICFFSGDITRGGGTERVGIQIANGLSRMGTYKVTILSLTEQNATPFFEIDEKIQRFSLGKHWTNAGPAYVKYLPKLRQFLKKQQFDVLIDIDLVLDVLSIPCTRGLKTKVISWEHFNAEFEHSVLYRRWIAKMSVRWAHEIVVLTEQDRRDYARIFGRTHHITKIYNPMERSNLPILPLEQRSKNLITVARLEEEKGIEYIAQIAPKLLKSHPNWNWIVLGDGTQRALLEQTIQEHGLQNRLILKGMVSNVHDFLQNSRIFVLTSKREGFGICLLEAMAIGVPCVSFDIQAGPQELIRQNQNGIRTTPFCCEELSSTLAHLMEHEEELISLAQGTQNDLEQFEMNTILQEWNQLLCK